jgi:hypothetical protein
VPCRPYNRKGLANLQTGEALADHLEETAQLLRDQERIPLASALFESGGIGLVTVSVGDRCLVETLDVVDERYVSFHVCTARRHVVGRESAATEDTFELLAKALLHCPGEQFDEWFR